MGSCEIPKAMLDQFEKVAFVAGLDAGGWESVLVRFRMGAESYGTMTFATDDRDLFQECLEEVEDAFVYVAMILYKARRLPTIDKTHIRDIVLNLGAAHRAIRDSVRDAVKE